MRDERFDGVESLGDEAGDVAVAAELANEADRVPEREVGLGRPRQGCVPRVQRPSRDGAPLGCGARKLGGARDVFALDDIPEEPAQPAVDRLESGVEHRRGVVFSHALGMACSMSVGLKLKNVAMTTPGVTAPSGAEREAK